MRFFLNSLRAIGGGTSVMREMWGGSGCEVLKVTMNKSILTQYEVQTIKEFGNDGHGCIIGWLQFPRHGAAD